MIRRVCVQFRFDSIIQLAEDIIGVSVLNWKYFRVSEFARTWVCVQFRFAHKKAWKECAYISLRLFLWAVIETECSTDAGYSWGRVS